MFARKTLPHIISQNSNNEIQRLCRQSALFGTRTEIKNEKKNKSKNDIRFNAMKIQMLPENLHRQVFDTQESLNNFSESNREERKEACIRNLKKFDLWNKNNEILPEVEFDLPPLQGSNIDEHFSNIATELSGDYFAELHSLATCSIPTKPKKWSNQAGWTKYISNSDGSESSISVDVPDEKGLIFDCEVLVPEGELPVMATAVSKNHWYSWSSERITKNVSPKGLAALIPLEWTQGSCSTPPNGQSKKIIVGHNVSYDRARVREQFCIDETNVRFMDTMSMHMAISGFTGTQRMLYKSAGKQETMGECTKNSSWLQSGSLNSLSDVHRYYCGSLVDKSVRNVFIDGSIEEIRKDFGELMSYCAGDVIATHNLLKKILPIFCKRFPHPVTFAAMLEMGQMYLPINRHWLRFIKMAGGAYDSMNQELKSTLMGIANDACSMLHGEKYKADPWLWDLDWTTSSHKMLKSPRKKWVPKERNVTEAREEMKDLTEKEREFLGKSQTNQKYKPSALMQQVLDTAQSLPLVRQHLCGYPKWYRELCMKENEEGWMPGPVSLSTLSKVTPKLLRMTWDGYPVHRHMNTGWGYLVPRDGVSNSNEKNTSTSELDDDLDTDFPTVAEDSTNKPVDIPDIPEGYLFYRMPHQSGLDKNVGSPLSQNFLQRIEEGILKSADPTGASRCLEINMSSSYWRSSRRRISSQIYMYLPEECLPDTVTHHPDYVKGDYGAILPLTIVNGTVTRRAVEPTWLTASNVRETSIASELKAMIQTPPGYDFVGADVDSQELWIASMLGDAESGQEHGCTPLSWMTLQGTKSNGTDMHSKTASAIAITRDQAKAFNYSRIYGAGQRLARTLLLNFNRTISKKEAWEKIVKLYSLTKGERKFILSMEGRYYLKKLKTKISASAQHTGIVTLQEVKMLAMAANDAYGHLKEITTKDLIAGNMWDGGMESEMFNKLEKIARSQQPRTPFLGARISRALEPSHVKGDFLPSRMNWVVQSSAVDYMHLMIVCMRWLINTYSIRARFSISIHDELRYLSVSEDKYRTALALQISNLLTRCMFAYKLGMKDLPLSVAFFSSVEIDKALRKKHDDECITPSNPMGLYKSCGIPPGQSLDIFDVLRKTNNGQLTESKVG